MASDIPQISSALKFYKHVIPMCYCCSKCLNFDTFSDDSLAIFCCDSVYHIQHVLSFVLHAVLWGCLWSSAAAANIMRLDSRHNQHWPAKHKNNIRCRVCLERGQRKTTVYKSAKCEVGLCVVPCFSDYHTIKIIKQFKLACVCVCSLSRDWRTTQGATEPLQQPDLCE